MDAMDLDPPEPQHTQPPPQPQVQQLRAQQQLPASRVTCPGIRVDPYPHMQNIPAGRYDPVHGAADSAWVPQQWPPHSYYSHQRSQSGSDVLSPFPGHDQHQASATNEPYAYQLPFGYQTNQASHHVGAATSQAGQDMGATHVYHSAPYPMPPMLHSGAAPRLAPLHQSFRGIERVSMSMAQLHQHQLQHQQQSFPASQGPAYGGSNPNSLRPQPSAAQPRSSRTNSHPTAAAISVAWNQARRANASAQPPPSSSGLLPQQHRTSHSSRRYRTSSSRPLSTASNGDMSSSPPRASRGGSGFLQEQEDEALREAQFARGAVTSKTVASQATLESLVKVDISTLPENERTCNICYNDFGVETPEGVTEEPVRVPGCKHVFGSGCIKTWFTDADHCPYCRTKVHSERKYTYPPGSVHALSAMQHAPAMARPHTSHLHIEGHPLSSEVVQQGIMNAHTAATASLLNGDRRPPPTNNEEAHRRQRARYETSRSISMMQYPRTPALHMQQQQQQQQQQVAMHVQHQRPQRPRTPPPNRAWTANRTDPDDSELSPRQTAPTTMSAAIADQQVSQQHQPPNSSVPPISMMVSQPSWQHPWTAATGDGMTTADVLRANPPAPILTSGVRP